MFYDNDTNNYYDLNFLICGCLIAIWANNTIVGWYATYLIVQNDGNIVTYGVKPAWEIGVNRRFFGMK